MKVLCLISVCLVAACYAATTTHKPHMHATHEPSEYESISFLYSPFTHNLLVKQRVNMMYNCYVATLTQNEIKHVHTDSGIRVAEVRVLSLLSSASPTMAGALDDHDVHMCGHGKNQTAPNYYTIS